MGSSGLCVALAGDCRIHRAEHFCNCLVSKRLQNQPRPSLGIVGDPWGSLGSLGGPWGTLGWPLGAVARVWRGSGLWELWLGFGVVLGSQCGCGAMSLRLSGSAKSEGTGVGQGKRTGFRPCQTYNFKKTPRLAFKALEPHTGAGADRR